jgi:hypothetical protein
MNEIMHKKRRKGRAQAMPFIPRVLYSQDFVDELTERLCIVLGKIYDIEMEYREAREALDMRYAGKLKYHRFVYRQIAKEMREGGVRRRRAIAAMIRPPYRGSSKASIPAVEFSPQTSSPATK